MLFCTLLMMIKYVTKICSKINVRCNRKSILDSKLAFKHLLNRLSDFNAQMLEWCEIIKFSWIAAGEKKRFCEDTLPPLSYLDDQSDGKSTPLRDKDRLGNDPSWFPGFLSRCSWMLPERLRNKFVLGGSEEIRQT